MTVTKGAGNNPKMRLIYICGLYTGEGSGYSEIQDNIIKAEQAMLKLLQKGWAVICPHKNSAHLENYEAFIGWDYEKWMQMSYAIMDRCDAVFFIKNWQSSNGAMKEFDYAQRTGLEIFWEEALGVENYPSPEEHGHITEPRKCFHPSYVIITSGFGRTAKYSLLCYECGRELPFSFADKKEWKEVCQKRKNQ